MDSKALPVFISPRRIACQLFSHDRAAYRSCCRLPSATGTKSGRDSRRHSGVGMSRQHASLQQTDGQQASLKRVHFRDSVRPGSVNGPGGIKSMGMRPFLQKESVLNVKIRYEHAGRAKEAIFLPTV